MKQWYDLKPETEDSKATWILFDKAEWKALKNGIANRRFFWSPATVVCTTTGYRGNEGNVKDFELASAFAACHNRGYHLPVRGNPAN